jgi:hypothetical protein
MALSRRLRAVARVLFIPVALATAPTLAASDPDRFGDFARAAGGGRRDRYRDRAASRRQADLVRRLRHGRPDGGLGMTADALFSRNLSPPGARCGWRSSVGSTLTRGSAIAWHAGICRRDHGITCSMSRAGNVWDNSAMESFFSSLKTERIAHKVYRTRDEARADIFDYSNASTTRGVGIRNWAT